MTCDGPSFAATPTQGRPTMNSTCVSVRSTTPRPAAEITITPSGRRVLTATGRDGTDAFDRGAEAALAACAAYGIRIAILKDASPSCGSRSVYDGSFRGRRVAGQGIAASR